MRVLLSAYACEPGTGSESGVGWHWAVEVAKLGFNTTVVTTSGKKIEIEEELNIRKYKNVQFIFYEPPRIFDWSMWYKFWPFAKGHRFYWFLWEHIYHFAWQYGAYRKVREIHEKTPFDIVHHITYGAVRRSTFMGNIKDARFVFGPLGGAERLPRRFRAILPLTAQITELVRDASIVISKFNPFLWSSFKKAHHIYVKTEESGAVVPKQYRDKVKTRFEIGWDKPRENDIYRERKNRGNGELTILFIGRFLYWKGMAYGIRAFSKLIKHYPKARLIMVGDGPEEKNWRKLVKSLHIENNVDWVSWVCKDDLKKYYTTSDIFLFPSLHDSSGNVVLESIMHGLPVVCLDLGGPARIVNEACAKICITKNKNTNDVIDSLCHQMIELSDNPYKLEKMRDAARKKSEEYFWPQVVSRLYDEVTAL